MAHGISAIDPADGRVDWQLEKVFLDRCVASPISAGGLVFGSFGFGLKGTRMVGVRPVADQSEPEIVIDLKETVMKSVRSGVLVYGTLSWVVAT